MQGKYDMMIMPIHVTMGSDTSRRRTEADFQQILASQMLELLDAVKTMEIKYEPTYPHIASTHTPPQYV